MTGETLQCLGCYLAVAASVMLRLQTALFRAIEELWRGKKNNQTVLILLTFSDSLLNLALRFQCYHTFQSSLRLQGQMEGAEYLRVHIVTMRSFQGFICYSCAIPQENYFSLS